MSGRAKTERISSRISGVQNATNDMTMFLAASAPAAAFSARAVCSQRYALGPIILRCVRANMRYHTFAARLCQRGFPTQSTLVSSSAGAAFVGKHLSPSNREFQSGQRMRAHGRQRRLFVPAHGLYSLIHNANAPPHTQMLGLAGCCCCCCCW